jgi:hypothetical protein
MQAPRRFLLGDDRIGPELPGHPTAAVEHDIKRAALGTRVIRLACVPRARD